ncbi:MAG: ribonuclease P protein component [Candidatus Melainabacteria bacterium]
MLAKPNRLKSPRLFERLLRGGRQTADRGAVVCLGKNNLFVVYALRHDPQFTGVLAPTQFGLIVSKKIDKRAVVRNRIKRRLRDLIRRQVLPLLARQASLPFRAVVIIARDGLKDAPFRLIDERLSACFQPPQGAS